MPMLDFSQTPRRGKATSRKSLKLVLGIGVISGAFALSSTLAANIALNDGGTVEFGQGITQTTACSDGQSLIVTPLSSFTNAAGAGSFKFTAVTVSDIPESCDGVDFLISAYNTSGDALPIFNTNSTVATIFNDAGTFKRGIGSAGMTVASTTGSFTVEFITPVTVSTDVARVTIQSTAHASLASLSCAEGGPCSLGDTGPGGGKVFFVSAGFDCGPTQNSRCNYLEVSPANWIAADRQRSNFHGGDIWREYPATIKYAPDFGISEIGAGYKYSRALPQGGSIGNARSYTGGGWRDWYIGSISEMNVLCKWVTGANPTVDTGCSGSENLLEGFEADAYYGRRGQFFTSNTQPGTDMNSPWVIDFVRGTGEMFAGSPLTGFGRPIRAF